MKKIDISICTIEDQVNLVYKLFGAYFITDKKYEIFAERVQADLILSVLAWEYLLWQFEKKNNNEI